MGSGEDATTEALLERKPSRRSRIMHLAETRTDKQRLEATWVRNNIKIRVCRRFVAAVPIGGQTDDDDSGNIIMCVCGRSLQQHPAKVSTNYKQPASEANGSAGGWNAEVDASEESTDTFGELDFRDSSKKVAKFIRLDERTDGQSLEKLLFTIWSLNKPDLVISVIGGSNLSETKLKVQQTIRRGLIKLARCGAWFLTGGLRQGVMRLAGDAASSTSSSAVNSVCLGVTPWGSVVGRQKLTNSSSPYPIPYSVKDALQADTILPLEPNHTHFILVDDGTERPRSTETVIRDKLEQMLIRTRIFEDDGKKNSVSGPASATTATAAKSGAAFLIPLCGLMLGGDLEALEMMNNLLRKNRPLVVVSGTGGLADVVAFAMKRLQPEDANNSERANTELVTDRFVERTDEAVAKKLRKIFDEPDEVKQLTASILFSVAAYSHLLHVYDCKDTNAIDYSQNLDQTILIAILQTGELYDFESKVVYQLTLAMQWNRIDVARSEILTNDLIVRTNSMVDLFTKAVAEDRHLFVRYLLDQGFNLHDYLNKEILEKLYNKFSDTPFMALLQKALKPKKRFGLRVFTSSTKSSSVTLSDVGKAIGSLCGGIYYSSYEHDSAYCDVNQAAIFISLEDHLRFLRQKEARKAAPSATSNEEKLANDNSLGDPALHLFFYAVLMNRRELAMIFWRELSQNLAAALAASFLLPKLVPYATDRDVRREISSNADFFGDLAIGVLDACYSADQEHTHLHILRELKEFANVTCLSLAEVAGNMRFLAHAACQSLLNSVWTGEMRNNNNIFIILLSLCFPPFIPIFIKFYAESPPKVLSSITPFTLQSEPTASSEDSCYRPSPDVPNLWQPLQRIFLFYTCPKIKFITDKIAYFLFVALYTHMILGQYIDNCEADGSFLETSLLVWAICLFVEELRQLASEPGTTLNKLKQYIGNPWNQFDALAISCLLIAQVLSVPNDLCYATIPYIRMLVSISIFIFYARVLQIYSANKVIGPKLVMIFRMFKDVVVIMVILVVYLIGFTVIVASMLTPAEQASFEALTGSLSLVYWSMFGNAPTEVLSNITTYPILQNVNGSLTITGYDNDPISGYYLVAFLGIFVILTNLLLFNVLIAMFNYTFSMVQEKSEEYWCYSRYKLIMEYYERPPLPPPMLLVHHFWIVASYLYRLVRAACLKIDSAAVFVDNTRCKIRTDETVERQIIGWEDLVVDEYLESVEQQEKQTINKQVEAIREHTTTMRDVLQFVASSVETSEGSSRPSSGQKNIDQRLTAVEQMVSELQADTKTMLRLLRNLSGNSTANVSAV